tara:strand:- start:895 stop:1125 length:231 start_codon:yes stop_codon:yes gene_type:complete
MTTPFRFPLSEQPYLFPEIKDELERPRLIKEENIKYYEDKHQDGTRHIRKVTETKIYYEGDNINKNPFCGSIVEIL